VTTSSTGKFSIEETSLDLQAAAPWESAKSDLP